MLKRRLCVWLIPHYFVGSASEWFGLGIDIARAGDRSFLLADRFCIGKPFGYCEKYPSRWKAISARNQKYSTGIPVALRRPKPFAKG